MTVRISYMIGFLGVAIAFLLQLTSAKILHSDRASGRTTYPVDFLTKALKEENFNVFQSWMNANVPEHNAFRGIMLASFAKNLNDTMTDKATCDDDYLCVRNRVVAPGSYPNCDFCTVAVKTTFDNKHLIASWLADKNVIANLCDGMSEHIPSHLCALTLSSFDEILASYQPSIEANDQTGPALNLCAHIRFCPPNINFAGIKSGPRYLSLNNPKV